MSSEHDEATSHIRIRGPGDMNRIALKCAHCDKALTFWRAANGDVVVELCRTPACITARAEETKA